MPTSPLVNKLSLYKINLLEYVGLLEGLLLGVDVVGDFVGVVVVGDLDGVVVVGLFVGVVVVGDFVGIADGNLDGCLLGERDGDFEGIWVICVSLRTHIILAKIEQELVDTENQIPVLKVLFRLQLILIVAVCEGDVVLNGFPLNAHD